jgi:sulfur-oxidizing protein SoxY
MQTAHAWSRRSMMMAAVGLATTARRAAAQATPPDDPWPSLATQIFGERQIDDGDTIIGIDAPYRAEDAAVVPISLHDLRPENGSGATRGITLVIDQNPSPLAATFSLAANSGIRTLSTRIRVDAYTNLHAVATAADGRLYQAKRFVKAAGGCSAPAAKMDADAVPLGTMRLRQFASDTDKENRQIQFMVRHPNYSGMQMDQVSRLYVPAHFVSSVRIWQGDDPLLAIESGISISENPTFRFDYRPNGASEFRAEVTDSQGQVFRQSWPTARA